jgi:hypothetical protein
MNFQTGENNNDNSALVVDNFSSFSDEGNAFGKLRDPLTDDSIDSIDDYQTAQALNNNLEDSISMVERSAKKFLPIYKELYKRMVQLKK